jgi:hypothetical protein
MIQFTLNIGTLDCGNPSGNITKAKAKNYDELVFQIEQAFESTDNCITVVALSIDKGTLTDFQYTNLFAVGVDFINGLEQDEFTHYVLGNPIDCNNPIVSEVRPVSDNDDDLPF